MDPATLQAAAAATTVLSALGVVGYVRQLVNAVKTHDRTLYGEESHEGWNGIVPMVEQHDEEIGTLYDLAEVDDETGQPYFPSRDEAVRTDGGRRAD